MGKHEKLLNKLAAGPKTFLFADLDTLLRHLGYQHAKSGKTSGSRIAYIHPQTKHIIRLHKPHPGNELKRYQIKYLVQTLKHQGYIK